MYATQSGPFVACKSTSFKAISKTPALERFLHRSKMKIKAIVGFLYLFDAAFFFKFDL